MENQREIKVRAWDASTNIMHYAEELDRFHTTKYNSGELIKRFDIINFYSGLKDKNGKEIYEGDILKSNTTGMHYEVKFNRGAFECLNRTMLHRERFELSEIVGNIYENPELLHT